MKKLNIYTAVFGAETPVSLRLDLQDQSLREVNDAQKRSEAFKGGRLNSFDFWIVGIAIGAKYENSLLLKTLE